MSNSAEPLFRRATITDLPSLYQCDRYAQRSETRRLELLRATQDGTCFLLEARDELLGFGILEHHFFGNGFVSLLCIAPPFQGQGLGVKLLHELENVCLTPKMFTSSNASNKPAQRIFLKAGFSPSGIVENLDEGDSEHIYYKMLVREPASPGPLHDKR